MAKHTQRRDGAAADLPVRSDIPRLVELVSQKYRPIGASTLRREIAHLPRIYVGRSALFETAAVLQHFADQIAKAPVMAGNIPPRHARGLDSAVGVLSRFCLPNIF